MSKRVTISLSDEMYRRIERARKAAKRDRSSFVQEAVEQRLATEDRVERDAAYIRGYTEVPETDEEYAFSDAAAREMFRLLDADEAGEA
ncbi:MAG TPA: ribbon-helix-helix protein, CopG family [Candidatus Limnocylindria bacterium]